MKALLIIIVVLLLAAGAIWFGYSQYKKSLVDKLLYNCQTGCEARRQYLMGQKLQTLKDMIAGITNFETNFDASQLVP